MACISVFKNICIFVQLLSFLLMTSQLDRPGFLDSSVFPDGPITLESYIFGYDIIHNSSINSTSHFLSVSPTFLTRSPYMPSFFSRNHSSFTFHTPAMSLLPSCLQFTFLTVHCCGSSHMIYSIIQRGAWTIDCLSEGGDFSVGGTARFDAFLF